MNWKSAVHKVLSNLACLVTSSTNQSETLESILEELRNQTNVEVICITNDGGTTIVQGVLIVNPDGSQAIFLDGVDVTDTYSQVPCPSPTTYDYETTDICVDGLTYSKTKVFDTEADGAPNLVTVLWFDENDNPIAAPDNSLINNENCSQFCPTSLGTVTDWSQLNP